MISEIEEDKRMELTDDKNEANNEIQRLWEKYYCSRNMIENSPIPNSPTMMRFSESGKNSR